MIGNSAGSALLRFFTLLGHDQSMFSILQTLSGRIDFGRFFLMQDQTPSAALAAEAPDLRFAVLRIIWCLSWCAPWQIPPPLRPFGSTPVWRQLLIPACCLTKDCYRVASCQMLPADHSPNYISTTNHRAICRVSGRSSKAFSGRSGYFERMRSPRSGDREHAVTSGTPQY